jgi:hypothetical protein
MTRARVVSILSGRCVCGLRLKLHRGEDNQSLSCEQAAEAHRRAKIDRKPLRELMRAVIDEHRRDR